MFGSFLSLLLALLALSLALAFPQIIIKTQYNTAL